MISLLSIIGPRGDPIIYRDYSGIKRGNVVNEFLSLARAKNVDIDSGMVIPNKPIIICDDKVFIYSYHNNIYVMIEVMNLNLPHILIIDMIEKLQLIIQNYTGGLSENHIKRNFTITNEIADEMFQNGLPIYFGSYQDINTHLHSNLNPELDLTGMITQWLSDKTPSIITKAYDEHIHNMIFPNNNNLAVSRPQRSISLLQSQSSQSSQNTAPSTSSSIPFTVHDSNNVYIDVIDRIDGHMYFDDSENERMIMRLSGKLNIKSYENEVSSYRIRFNESLSTNDYDMLFNESVLGHRESFNISELPNIDSIPFQLGKGDITLMKYRHKIDHLPFSLSSHVEFIDDSTISMTVEFKHRARRYISGSCSIRLSKPVWVTDITGRVFSNGNDDMNENCKVIVDDTSLTYVNPSMVINSTMYCKKEGFTVRMSIDSDRAALNVVNIFNSKDIPGIKRIIGPMQIQFGLCSYCSSGIQIRSLVYNELLSNRVGRSPPTKWVRYTTTSGNFTASF